MRFDRFKIRFLRCLCFFLLSIALFLVVGSENLSSDGTGLLSFKRSILSDPLSALQSWSRDDEATPCDWNGVVCGQIGGSDSPEELRVTGLVLPESQLLGSISPELFSIEHLRRVDLSGNFLNGSLPETLPGAAELEVLDLGSNVISGGIPASFWRLRSLRALDLSDNALSGRLPENLTGMRNLTVVSLRSNYFSGGIPVGFGLVEELDLSSNLLNGSLPSNFSGERLRYLNCSYNKISGSIPPKFADHIPENATVDLSFNNLTGAIPESATLLKQKTEAFAGNDDLCGKPMKTLCSVPSTLSTPPNNTSPAIAVIPESPKPPNRSAPKRPAGMKPATIAGIAAGDIAGIAVLAAIILYVYNIRKRKTLKTQNPAGPIPGAAAHGGPDAAHGGDGAGGRRAEMGLKQNPFTSCLAINGGEGSSEAASSETEMTAAEGGPAAAAEEKRGMVVTVDGEGEIEAERLFTASAYVLGSSWAGIVYRAVLEDGTALAVRRIGAEVAVRGVRDFEEQVRAIARLRHPNLVRVRGFYLGEDERLVIHDYVSNGSLAAAAHRKMGSTPIHMSLEVRLKIARGVARGLTYIHEKKFVHGNIKPSNIMLDSDMEPLISDLGLDKLVSGHNSARQPGSNRFGAAQDTFPASSTPYVLEGSSVGGVFPYQAPESLKTLKPNPKWDVYAFGIVLLELLSGKMFTDSELAQWATNSMAEERSRVLRLSDASIIDDVEFREDAMLACFRLGFSCASLVPQKRPLMREALQVLEKIQ